MTGKGTGSGNSHTLFELLEPRVLLSTSSTVAGLLGEYYSPGAAVTDYPNFATLSPVHSRIDGRVNFVSGTADFGGYADLDDEFAVRWTGKINISAEGTNPVIFYTQSDDGSRLYIDNQLVVDNPGVRTSMTEASGTITLAAGMHDIRLEYFEHTGGAGVILRYDPADGSKQVIPGGVLYHTETNLLTNPGFETGTITGWDTNSNDGISINGPHTGTYADRLYSNGYWVSQGVLSQLTAGVEYTFSAYAMVTVEVTSAGAPKLRVSLNQDLSSPDFGEAAAVNSLSLGWQKLEVRRTFTLEDLAQPGIFVGVINDNFNGRSKVDDVFAGLIGVEPAPVPIAPGGLSATPNSPTQITLGWNDNSTDEDGFYLDRGPNGTTWNQTFDLPAGTKSYTDTGLTPGATYYYRVRAYSANGISTPSGTASVTTPAELVFLVPTEVMVHPAVRVDGKNLEFLELYNSDSAAHDLAGYTFSDGITLTFTPGTTIAAHGYLVLAANPADLRSAYGISASIPIIAYAGTLDDNGERVRLVTAGGTVQFDFNYDDTASWPVSADGAGHSLVLKDVATNPNLASSWSGSAQIGGSPTTADPAAPPMGVVLNEYLASPASSGQDFIELYNPTGASITLEGYYLSHDASNLKQFRIPGGTTIAAGGFVYFTQTQLGFDLNGAGDDIYLTDAAGTRVVDAIRFDATPVGMSFGRYRDGQNSWRAMTAPSAGTANVNPFVGDVVINEIMYHPPDLAVYPVDNVKEEYVELYNKGSYSVDLGGWYFKGMDFEFAPGTIIGAGQYLVVVADVAAFKARYGSGITNLVGAYGLASKLDNSGESLQLFNTSDFLIDVVQYGDYAPWPVQADGSSTSQYFSIELINPSADNDTPRNWKDSPAGATPGRQNGAYNATWLPAWIQNTRISEDPAAPGSNQPAPNQPITVTAEVFGAKNPVLTYMLNFSTTQVQLSMFDDGLHGDGAAGDGVYGAIIPAQPGSTYIRYKVTATSTVGGTNPQDPVAFDASLKWHGTVVRDPSIVTNAPVYYWLINPASFTMGNSGTGAFFYNGEYYEGVSYGPRGNTASSFWKKHYGFHFPVGHKFHGAGVNQPGDLNDDGLVDVGDLGILGANYGRSLLPTGLPTGLPSGLPSGLSSGLASGLPSGLPGGLPSGLSSGLDDSLIQSFSPAPEFILAAPSAPADAVADTTVPPTEPSSPPLPDAGVAAVTSSPSAVTMPSPLIPSFDHAADDSQEFLPADAPVSSLELESIFDSLAPLGKA